MQLFGCICLIAGTAIGAGMIALPLTLAKFGIFFSCLLMLATWVICYLSAILNLELNLRAGKGLPLSALGYHFSGYKAYLAGAFSLTLLCYALLSAYIYGAASCLIEIFPWSLQTIAMLYSLLLGIILMSPLKIVDHINRILFAGLVISILVIVVRILLHIDFSVLPLNFQQGLKLKEISVVLPVVFTAFGFQVIFHSITNYCNKNKVILKRAFFWGSLIPALIYIAWTLAVCGLIYKHRPELFQKMVFSSVEIGEMVQTLSHISQNPFTQQLIWVISFLAIFTSAIGVLLGLIDALKTKHPVLNYHSIATITAIIPSLCIALFVPNAFIKALSFAGMVLSFLAIIIPLYLLSCATNTTYHYPILKSYLIKILLLLYALWIIAGEFWL